MLEPFDPHVATTSRKLDQVGDHARQLLVAGRQVRQGCGRAAAQMLGSPAQERAGQELLGVGQCQRLLAGLRQRDAEREERALGAEAPVERRRIRPAHGFVPGRSSRSGAVGDQAREPRLAQLEPTGDPLHQLVEEQAGGHRLEHRAELAERAVAPLGAARVGAIEDPLDLEDDERDRGLDLAAQRVRPLALDQLSRVGPRREWDDAELELARGRRARGAQHRVLAGAVGVEAQLEHLRHDALELADLLLGQRGAHDPDRVAQLRPGAARARRCSPRPGSSARPWRRPPGPDRSRTAPRACGRARRRRCSGTSAAGCRASPARRSRARGRASADGNMIRSRKRSKSRPGLVLERCARPTASSSSSLKPALRDASRIRSQALGRVADPELAQRLLAQAAAEQIGPRRRRLGWPPTGSARNRYSPARAAGTGARGAGGESPQRGPRPRSRA